MNTISQESVISIEYNSRRWYIIEVLNNVVIHVTKTNKQRTNCRKMARKIAEKKGLKFVEDLGRSFLPKPKTQKKNISIEIFLPPVCPICNSENFETWSWDESSDTTSCKCLNCGQEWFE